MDDILFPVPHALNVSCQPCPFQHSTLDVPAAPLSTATNSQSKAEVMAEIGPVRPLGSPCPPPTFISETVFPNNCSMLCMKLKYRKYPSDCIARQFVEDGLESKPTLTRVGTSFSTTHRPSSLPT